MLVLIEQSNVVAAERRRRDSTDSVRFSIPLYDPQGQYQAIKTEIEAAVLDVLASPAFHIDPVVEQCERAVANYCGCAHGVGVASGSDAVRMALMAEKIGRGDQVITTACASLGSAVAILRTGATPVFVDIDPATYTIDPELIESRLTSRTRAVMPVYRFGRMADMEPILDLARRFDLVVIEEASQAIGAEYGGRRAGSLGHYGAMSFRPSINSGGVGDGGLVTTNDPERAERVRWLRDQGCQTSDDLEFAGQDLTLDAIQAAIVMVKLKYLDGWTQSRRANAARYRQLLGSSGLFETRLVIVAPDAFLSPKISELSPHAYNQFVVRLTQRDELQTYLMTRGIETDADCLLPVHRQACLARLGYSRCRLPESERAARECLALPVYPELTPKQQERVVRSIAEFYGLVRRQSGSSAVGTDRDERGPFDPCVS